MMKVYVYWNLHKGGFSIKALDGAAKGRVIAYASDVFLRDVSFKVSERGRLRSITRHKEVHAGMQGRLAGFAGTVTAQGELAGVNVRQVADAMLLKLQNAAAITYN